jgi:CHAD domain-containing protein
MRTSSVRALTNEQIRELLGHLAGVRDGRPDSVHRARIATRRLRELLPLLTAVDPRQVADTRDLLRKAGRALGRVRELDVMHSLLEQEELRLPAVAAATAVARAALRPKRDRARRKMIKTLERLGLEQIGDVMLPLHRRWDVTRLRTRIGTRTARLREAVQDAGGVYFPRRIHQVRMASKKLRYAVEVACRTGLWRSTRLLRDMRRLQGMLGEIHDMQVLADRLDSLFGHDENAADRRLLAGALQGEIGCLHQDYLERRDRTHAMVAACHRFAASPFRPPSRGHVVAASAIVAPMLLWLGYRNVMAEAPAERRVAS